MSTYRYFATDVVTGALRATEIPLHVTSFSRNLGGVGQPGQLTGYLDLGAIPNQAQMLAALEPRRSLLWAQQDGFPVWAGIVWDWPHTSAASNRIPILADELGSLFSRRQIRDNLTWNNVDTFDLLRNVINYATSVSIKGAQAAVAQLVMTSTKSGVTTSESVLASNLTKAQDSLDQLSLKYNLEYAWDPGVTSSGAPIITARIGNAATMGRPYSATNLQLIYPGNAIDYLWPRTGSQGRNSVLAIASGGGGVAWASNYATHGEDTADLAAGFPLLEDSVSYTGSVINTQAQIDAFADYRQQLVAKAPTVGRFSVAGGQTPTVQQVQLGDHAMAIATSTYHPAGPGGAPGLVQDGRIIGWTVYPPDAEQKQTERTDFFLGGVST